MIVISTGCPAGVGPEVSVAAAARLRNTSRVLVGERATLLAAAELRGIPRSRFIPFRDPAERRKIQILEVGPKLPRAALKPGALHPLAGEAQLAYIETAFDLARSTPRAALVTAPASKACVAGCGREDARRFLGHTEWLGELDGAPHVTMCFAAPRLVTSLVTTHLPLSRVSDFVAADGVARAARALAWLLAALGHPRPRIAVCSLNPHAGEGELLGDEERRAIAPGIRQAQTQLGRKATILGPVGAETAYRKAYAGEYAGVVAMYHDQATIPMKLVAFGDAVNVTVGLSVPRTSVDHGTGYDIAWRGCASTRGMSRALACAQKLAATRRAFV